MFSAKTHKQIAKKIQKSFISCLRNNNTTHYHNVSKTSKSLTKRHFHFGIKRHPNSAAQEAKFLSRGIFFHPPQCFCAFDASILKIAAANHPTRRGVFAPISQCFCPKTASKFTLFNGEFSNRPDNQPKTKRAQISISERVPWCRRKKTQFQRIAK